MKTSVSIAAVYTIHLENQINGINIFYYRVEKIGK